MYEGIWTLSLFGGQGSCGWCPWCFKGRFNTQSKHHFIEEDFNIDLSQSWMIGDDKRDMEAGKAVGCQTMLLATE